jgi:hypothetical protein
MSRLLHWQFSWFRTSKSVFEKDGLGHDQRLMRVAAAAMVMRDSATAVSCS